MKKKPTVYCHSLIILSIFLGTLLFNTAAKAEMQHSQTMAAQITVPTGVKMGLLSDGSILAIGTATSNFKKISADGLSETSITYNIPLPTSLSSIDFAINENNLYINMARGGSGEIRKVALSENTADYVASQNITSTGVALIAKGADNNLYASRGNNLLKFDSDLNTNSSVYTLKAIPAKTYISTSNTLYYATSGGSGKLYQSTSFSSMPSINTDITLNITLNNTNGIAIIGDSIIYIASTNAIRKYSLSPELSTSVLWTKPISSPSISAMAINERGVIYLLNNTGNVSVYDPINAPSTLNAELIGNSISLNWTTGISDTDFSGVTIRRSVSGYPESPTADGSLVTENITSVTQLIDYEIGRNQTYYYTVFNKTLDGFYSTGTHINIIVPPNPPAISATKPTPNGSIVNLSWDIPIGVNQFLLKRSHNGNPEETVSENINSSVTSYTDETHINGLYVYTIYAINASNNTSNAGFSNSIVIDTSAPESPTILATKSLSTSINLNWNIPLGTQSLILKRIKNDETEVTLNSSLTEEITSYTDDNLTDGTYIYKLYAKDGFGNISDPGISSTIQVDTTGPEKPSMISAISSNSTIILNWNNPISDFDSITIVKSTSEFILTPTGGILVTQNITATSLTQADLTDGTYYFSIFAKDPYGNYSLPATINVSIIQSIESTSLLASKVLPYPNPSKAKNGTEIGYLLSQDADIELKLYSMLGNEIYSTRYTSGDTGGKVGYNKVPISPIQIGYTLSAGPYFYILLNKGSVIGKGKLAIIP